MIEKQTEEFFEKMLTEEKDIENAYLDAFSEWDKPLFKIQFPSFVCRHKKTETAEVQDTKQRSR